MIWPAALLALAGLLAVRVLYILTLGRGKPLKPGSGPVKTMIVLGSGAYVGGERSRRCARA